MATAAVAPTVQWMEGSVNLPLAKYPKAATELDPQKTAEAVLESINSALSKKDYAGLSKLFLDDGYWRDHLALTWEFHTKQGPAAIESLLQEASKSRDGFRVTKLTLDDDSKTRKPAHVKIDGNGTVDVVQFYFTWESEITGPLKMGRAKPI